MIEITWESGKKQKTDTNHQRGKAPLPQTRGSLPVFCSYSITLNLQSIGWPSNTREGVGCPHRCLHFKEKKNSFTTIDLPLAFRQVRYINNAQQKDPQKEKKNEKWLSLVQSPFLTWHCAKWVVIFSFPSFFVFLSRPSRDSAAVRAWQHKSFTALPHCVSKWDGISA